MRVAVLFHDYIDYFCDAKSIINMGNNMYEFIYELKLNGKTRGIGKVSAYDILKDYKFSISNIEKDNVFIPEK